MDSSAVLTQRYHGAILALALGIPCAVIGQAPDDKLMTLAGELNLPCVLLAAWDGDPHPLISAAHPLTSDQRASLLQRCEDGQRTLAAALNNLQRVTRNE